MVFCMSYHFPGTFSHSIDFDLDDWSEDGHSDSTLASSRWACSNLAISP